MSLRSNGKICCDRCGADVGGGGVDTSTVVSRYNPETYTVDIFHLCLVPQEGAPNGCSGRVLGPGTLADYNDSRK